jgi:hypothetical protein
MESPDGLSWSEPRIAYQPVRSYLEEPPAPAHLTKYGRFERPQLLLRGERPAYLFTAAQGGRYQTASGFVFEVRGSLGRAVAGSAAHAEQAGRGLVAAPLVQE